MIAYATSRVYYRIGLSWAAAESYFFRPGGAYAISICRVALFSYLFIHVIGDVGNSYLQDGAVAYLSRVNTAAYHPKSLVWILFPTEPPPAWFIDTVLQTARISTLMALLGLLTRPAMIVSTLTSLFLAALVFSWEPLWSHPYNSGLLAGLAFMFGRAGDTLSIDSLVARHILRRPITTNRDVYWWPVILGQFGIAAVYFGGFYAKWSTPAFSYDLSWVFSDNLRNSVALPWLIRGQQLPWNVALIVNNPWIWKLSALAHLLTQALPILAMLSLNKPLARLAEGFVFIAGVFLLKLVMGMWNPAWMILAAFFVDWEYFMRKAGFELKARGRPATRPPGPRNAVIGYALAFVVLNIGIIATRFDDTGKNRLYPVSSMGFYSNVAASKPYDEHRHYPFTYGELFFNYPDGSQQKWSCYTAISNAYLMTLAGEKPAAIKVEQQADAMKAILGTLGSYRKLGHLFDCAGTIDIRTFESIDLFSSVLNIPPYPEPARFEVGHRALVSRYERDRNRIIAAGGQLSHEGNAPNATVKVHVTSSGLDVARYDILVSNDPWENRNPGPLMAAPGNWIGDEFIVDETFYRRMLPGRYPVVVRVTEHSGRTYDFFSGILYRARDER